MFILPGRHHIVYTSGVNERFRASWTRMSLWQCDTICTLPGWQSLNLIVPVALYQLHCYVSQHPFIRIKAVYAIRCVFFKFSFSSLFFQRITLKAIKPQWSCTFPSFQAKLRSGAAKKCAKYEDALQFRFRFFDIHWRENSCLVQSKQPQPNPWIMFISSGSLCLGMSQCVHSWFVHDTLAVLHSMSECGVWAKEVVQLFRNM